MFARTSDKNLVQEISLTAELQHGIPRGSGVRPATDPDRRKEQQKIKDYGGLVNSVKEKVSCFSCFTH